MSTARVTISVPPGVLKRIDTAARALSMSRSEFISNVMDDHLAEGQAIIGALSDDRIRNAFHEAFTRPGVLKALTSEMGQELSDSQRQKFLQFIKPSGTGKRPR